LLKLIGNRKEFANITGNEKYKNQMHKVDIIEDGFEILPNSITESINYLKKQINTMDAQLLKDLNRDKLIKIDKGSALEIISSVDDTVKKDLNLIKIEFSTLLACIIVAKDFPEVTVRKKSQTRNKTTTRTNQTNSKEKSTHVIKLGEKVIYTLDSTSDESKLFKKSYNRKAESWDVMGHDRKYKNGKVVHVKPYVKGKGNKVKRDYKL
jgi:hypothetical protein